MAELKEAEQPAGKRQKKIEALKLKLTLGLGDAYLAHLLLLVVQLFESLFILLGVPKQKTSPHTIRGHA